MERYLGKVEGDPLNRASLLREAAWAWRDNGVPPALLHKAVHVGLRAASTSPGWLFGTRLRTANQYFRLHEKLRRSSDLTHEQAKVLLGYGDLVGLLASRQQMSSAQIAEVLAARGKGSRFPWRAVQQLLSEFERKPKVMRPDFEAQIAEDREAELVLFADAMQGDASHIVAEAAQRLGFDGDLSESLQALVNDGEADRTTETIWSYVFMLHYSVSADAWFDHPPQFAYEFEPRGEKAIRVLLPKYRPNADPKSSPFLNNAKSVDRLDSFWADSKVSSGRRGAATALVAILDGLAGLPYPGRRQLAALLRQWCWRQVLLCGESPTQLPSFSLALVTRALTKIPEGNSRTLGILEQRVVDALTAYAHPTPTWASRGLGDAVNASNRSRRKLGDCEFTHVEDLRVDAYEAHGGVLRQAYLDQHLQGFETDLGRSASFELAAADQWDVRVTYVAHAIDASAPDPIAFDRGVAFVRLTTYDEWFAQFDPNDLLAKFNEHLVAPLNEPRTPDSIRRRVAEFLDLDLT